MGVTGEGVKRRGTLYSLSVHEYHSAVTSEHGNMTEKHQNISLMTDMVWDAKNGKNEKHYARFRVCKECGTVFKRDASTQLWCPVCTLMEALQALNPQVGEN